MEIWKCNCKPAVLKLSGSLGTAVEYLWGGGREWQCHNSYDHIAFEHVMGLCFKSHSKSKVQLEIFDQNLNGIIQKFANIWFCASFGHRMADLLCIS